MNTTLCYLECGSRYLMLHRIKKEQDVNCGKWIGIGGKFEPHESPEECLLREVAEETALIPTDVRYRGIVTFDAPPYPTEYMHLFTASASDASPLADCDEGDLAWVEKGDIDALPLWEGDRIFLHLLRTDAPFFSLKLVYDGDLLKTAILNQEVLDLQSAKWKGILKR